jgi:type-F conjugative transfer system pilin assembly protein TrbC
MRANIIIWLNVIVFMAFLLSGSTFAGDLDQESVNAVIKRRDDMLHTMQVPSNSYVKEGQDRALKIMEKVNSNEYQARLRTETDRLKATVFKDSIDSFSAMASLPASSLTAPLRLSPDERLYIFVSSSMPLKTLRNYAGSIDRANDPNIVLVMRGFVAGMKEWKKMIEFSSNVLVRDRGCDVSTGQCGLFAVNLEVDPLLFRRYQVSAVPTVVYARGVSRSDTVLSEGLADIARVSELYSVSGDSSLAYALEVIRQETGSATLDRLVDVLGRNDIREE